MPEMPVRPDAFFARGIEGISHRGIPLDSDLSQLPGLQRLAPAERNRLPALEQLFAGSAFDGLIDAAIRPVIAEPEMLLPRPFSRALEDAHETLRRMSERHGHPAVLERAEKILAQEQEWRALARMYRDALHQV